MLPPSKFRHCRTEAVIATSKWMLNFESHSRPVFAKSKMQKLCLCMVRSFCQSEVKQCASLTDSRNPHEAARATITMAIYCGCK